MSEDDGRAIGQFDVPTLETIEIPDKTHFKIGEVAKLLELEPYVLRYWEKEFDVLEPSKTESGQRAYQRDDIELLATIRELLYTEMFTIDGARRQLERAREGKPSYLTSEPGPAEQPDDGRDDELEELEWENAQLRRELEEVQDDRLRLENRVEELEQGDDEDGAWRERARELEDEAEQLRAELAAAQEELEALEEREGADGRGGADPEIVEELRGELSELADLADSAEVSPRRGR